jgi:transmembrane sensor
MMPMPKSEGNGSQKRHSFERHSRDCEGIDILHRELDRDMARRSRAQPDAGHPDLPDETDRQAAAWFARVNGGAAERQELEAFSRWLNADAAHRAAYARLEADWRDMDGLDDLRAEAAQVLASLPQATPRHASRPLSRRAALAAAFGGAAALGVLAVTQGGIPAGGLAGILADHRTGRRGQAVGLADGTRLRLDAGTNLSEATEGLILHGGRAFFQTASGQRLTVEANAGRIEAGNARFSLGHLAGSVDLSVIEGSVDLNLPGTRPLNVTAGHGLRFSRTGAGRIVSQDRELATAWLRSRLVFDAQPLSEAVELINRYRAGRVILVDSDLRDLKISGSFAIDQTDDVLQVVTTTLPVSAIRLTDYLVLLRAA